MKNRCNVSNREDVIRVAEKVRKDVGDVTILVNNAGILRIRPFLEQTSEDIQETININMMAHFWVCIVYFSILEEKLIY